MTLPTMTQNEQQSPAQARVSWRRIARRIRVPLGFVFAIFYLWRAQPTWLSLALGALVAAFGLVVRAVASGHVDKNEELATTGPFAYVRNPLYLGSIVVAIGCVIAARDLILAALVALLFAVIYVPTIHSEEEYLHQRFVGDYADYAQRVPRLLPRTLSFTGMTDGFSRALYMKHREYNALFGAVVMWAALAAKILWFRG